MIRISHEYFTDKKYFLRYLVNYWFCFFLLDCHSFILSNSVVITLDTRYRFVLHSKIKSFIHGISSASETTLCSSSCFRADVTSIGNHFQADFLLLAGMLKVSLQNN